MTQVVAMLNIQQTWCIMSPCLKRLLAPCTLGFIHTWASTSVIASTIGLKFPVLSANRILFLSKKVFQSNANRPLSESPCFIVNKSEHMRRGWAGPCTMRSQMNKFKPVWRWGQDPVLGGGPAQGNPLRLPPPQNRQKDTTENILLLQFRWRAVNMSKAWSGWQFFRVIFFSAVCYRSAAQMWNMRQDVRVGRRLEGKKSQNHLYLHLLGPVYTKR